MDAVRVSAMPIIKEWRLFPGPVKRGGARVSAVRGGDRAARRRITPALLGTGESLLTGIDLVRLGYRVSEQVATAKATHVVLTRDTGVERKT